MTKGDSATCPTDARPPAKPNPVESTCGVKSLEEQLKFPTEVKDLNFVAGDKKLATNSERARERTREGEDGDLVVSGGEKSPASS